MPQKRAKIGCSTGTLMNFKFHGPDFQTENRVSSKMKFKLGLEFITQHENILFDYLWELTAA